MGINLSYINRTAAYALLCFLLAIVSLPAAAQLNFDFTEGKSLIKGQIKDLKTEGAIPFANIWITNQKKGITCDGEGKFVMYVYPNDTLQFSSLGYITKTIPISAVPQKDRYTITMLLVPDIYSFKTVNIYPYRNKEEFIDAFIKGKGIPQVVTVSGIDAPKYQHKEKPQYYNPISSLYKFLQRKKSAANPDFKP